MAHKPPGKSGLFVVVFEWATKKGRWRPYSPEVTQQLERAFGKKLTSVYLGDADPALKNYCVVFSTMKQVCSSSGVSVNIRRNLYPQNSPAGQGAVWEWSGDSPEDWHTYDMCVQCALEDHWAEGAQMLDLSSVFQGCPYVINFTNLSQANKKTGFVRAIRRKKQAAYPIGRPATPQQPTSGNQAGPIIMDFEPGNSNAVPPSSLQQSNDKSKTEPSGAKAMIHRVFNFSGGNVLSSNSGKNLSKAQNPPPRPPKPLPRNIKSPPVPKPRTLFPSSQSSWSDVERSSSADAFKGSTMTLDSDVSLLSNRRPSIETISTYLSQDSYNSDSTCTTPIMNCNGPKMEDLIDIGDSFSENEDEVFSIDQEICEVMMKNHTLEDSPDSYSQRSTGEPNMYPDLHSHFVPITSAEESEAVASSVLPKRQRTDNSIPLSTNPYHPGSKRLPTTTIDKLLSRFCSETNMDLNYTCTICMKRLYEKSGFHREGKHGYVISHAVSLKICGHGFHEDCISRCVVPTPSQGFLACPNCKVRHGKEWGNQPEGRMAYDRVQQSLPGFPHCGTIRIVYSFKSGIQGPDDPNPGQPYYARGFPKMCFLPDNMKGNKVLKLLVQAFNQRLIFTIEITNSGAENELVWNDICHKTEWNNITGKGYPDPDYLDRVLQQLQFHGIVE